MLERKIGVITIAMGMGMGYSHGNWKKGREGKGRI
jgi:hypothetical protein